MASSSDSGLRRDRSSHLAKVDPLSNNGWADKALQRVVVRVFAVVIVEGLAMKVDITGSKLMDGRMRLASKPIISIFGLTRAAEDSLLSRDGGWVRATCS